MAKIGLSESNFSVIPEGRTVFKITGSTYDTDFGKLEIQLITASGQKHTERFNLMTNDGEVNEKANNAFSYLAKTALNNFNLEEIDTDDLTGCYFAAMVEHDVQPSNRDPNKTVTFIRLGSKEPASGFESTPAKPAAKATTENTSDKPASGSIDLDALLG